MHMNIYLYTQIVFNICTYNSSSFIFSKKLSKINKFLLNASQHLPLLLDQNFLKLISTPLLNLKQPSTAGVHNLRPSAFRAIFRSDDIHIQKHLSFFNNDIRMLITYFSETCTCSRDNDQGITYYFLITHYRMCYMYVHRCCAV